MREVNEDEWEVDQDLLPMMCIAAILSQDPCNLAEFTAKHEKLFTQLKQPSFEWLYSLQKDFSEGKIQQFEITLSKSMQKLGEYHKTRSDREIPSESSIIESAKKKLRHTKFFKLKKVSLTE